jgi:hypothetical protein
LMELAGLSVSQAGNGFIKAWKPISDTEVNYC